MKRVTILFDDERPYRELKTEAARAGRPVKDAVAEAVGDWFRGRTGLSPAERERWQAVLREADDFRRRQSVQATQETIEDALEAIRDEHSRSRSTLPSR